MIIGKTYIDYYSLHEFMMENEESFTEEVLSSNLPEEIQLQIADLYFAPLTHKSTDTFRPSNELLISIKVTF